MDRPGTQMYFKQKGHMTAPQKVNRYSNKTTLEKASCLMNVQANVILADSELRARKKALVEKEVQRIDLRGLESNCSAIVLPPFSSSAPKPLIDTHVLRPPIPEAHPLFQSSARPKGTRPSIF